MSFPRDDRGVEIRPGQWRRLADNAPLLRIVHVRQRDGWISTRRRGRGNYANVIDEWGDALPRMSYVCGPDGRPK